MLTGGGISSVFVELEIEQINQFSQQFLENIFGFRANRVFSISLYEIDQYQINDKNVAKCRSPFITIKINFLVHYISEKKPYFAYVL